MVIGIDMSFEDKKHPIWELYIDYPPHTRYGAVEIDKKNKERRDRAEQAIKRSKAKRLSDRRWTRQMAGATND